LNKIAQLAPSARAEIFGETANRLGLPEALVEKDFWACWMLAQIFSIEPFRGTLLFKGGTSLSKIFGVIQRFSEDIDLAVDYSMLGFTGTRDPHAPGLSRTRQGALLDEMLHACRTYIEGDFLRHLRARCVDALGPESTRRLIVDGQDPHIVHFFYPPSVAGQLAYIAPQVVLELGTHAEFIPRGEFTIRSFAAAEFPDLFGQADIPVTSLLAKRSFGRRLRSFTRNIIARPTKPLLAPLLRCRHDGGAARKA